METGSGNVKMFCPGCGKPNSIDQKFCRACGINLEQSAASLREQYPDSERLDLKKQEMLLERYGQIVFSGFGVALGLGIVGLLYAILTNIILSGTRPYFGLLLMGFIIFAGLSLGYVIWNESLKEKRARIDKAPGLAGHAESSAAPLTDGSAFEPVPSVTENTTRKLKSERRRDV